MGVCDRVCVKGPLVERYKTEITAVKVNWSILVGLGKYANQVLFHIREAVESYFKLISKLEVAVFFRANERFHLSHLNLEI